LAKRALVWLRLVWLERSQVGLVLAPVEPWPAVLRTALKIRLRQGKIAPLKIVA
jgi:hypothetical protein